MKTKKPYEQVSIWDLEAGDIFTYQLKLKRREAFSVESDEHSILKIKSRNYPFKTSKLKKSTDVVIFLRTEEV